ncbi:MAG TPA: hypothetical protein VGH87_05510, partial [Polyangiaceae bacterium]
MKRRDMLAAALVAAGAIAGVAWLLAHTRVFEQSPPSAVIDAGIDEVPATQASAAGNILDFIVFDAYVAPPPTACDVFASRNDAVVAALAARDGCSPPKIGSLPCESVGASTWAIAVDHAAVTAECETQFSVKLVRLDVDGGETSAPNLAPDSQSAHDTFALRALSDYDGDGSP